MSGLATALNLLSIFTPQRIIDPDNYGLIAHVTISEDTEDELEITQHPVEEGATITDHAFKRPSTLRMQLGWTQSGVYRPPGLPVINVTAVWQIYHQILALQESRQPFKIYTPKRMYENMLIASVRTTTDEKTETSLMADIVFRQILIAKTQLTSPANPSSATPNTNAAQLGSPQNNLPEVTQGTVQPLPTSYLNPRDIPGVGF